jgi:RNA methyltransferase, TrmH family
VRSVEELLSSQVEVRAAVVSSPRDEDPRIATLVRRLSERDTLVQHVTVEEFASAAETDSPQGILAIGVVPEATLADLPVSDPLRILVLDAVQDPGNAGTMLRTAAALSVTATFSLPGTVDLWNAKVVRSGMGAHFHHPCLAGTWDELDAFRRERSLAIWAADAAGEPLGATTAPDRIGLILGNEGSGLSSQSRERADCFVALPIATTVESLNVAVAAGIFLYELHR